jgi:hypothetical protein
VISWEKCIESAAVREQFEAVELPIEIESAS